MSLLSRLKWLLIGGKGNRSPPEFTDADRGLSAFNRRMAVFEKKRQQAKLERMQDLELRQLELEIKKAEYELEEEYETDEGEEEPVNSNLTEQAEQGAAKLIKVLGDKIAGNMSAGNSENPRRMNETSTPAGSISLPDKEIKKLIDQIPENQINMIKMFSEKDIKAQMKERYKQYTEDTLTRAYKQLKVRINAQKLKK